MLILYLMYASVRCSIRENCYLKYCDMIDLTRTAYNCVYICVLAFFPIQWNGGLVVSCIVGGWRSVCWQLWSPEDRLRVPQIASQLQHHLHIKTCSRSVLFTHLLLANLCLVCISCYWS